MSLGDHLEELRRRSIHALIGVGVAFLFTMWYGRSIVAWVLEPLSEAQRAAGLPRYVVGHSVTASLTVYLMVSLVAAAIFATPWILFQIWRFASKGLYPKEQKQFYLFAPLSATMSLLAVLFTYYLFMPAVLSFLLAFSIGFHSTEHPKESHSFLRWVSEKFAVTNEGGSMVPIPSWPWGASATKPANPTETTQPALPVALILAMDHDPEKPVDGQIWFNSSENELRLFAGGRVSIVPLAPLSMISPQLEIGQYLRFFAVTTLIVVIAFQIPVLMLLLSISGLVGPKPVAKYRKYIVYVLVCVCVLILPSQDIFTNVGLPIVLWLLFEFGLVLMWLTYKEPVEMDEEISDE